MSRILIPFVVFLFLALEGTLFQLIVPSPFTSDLVVVPRFLAVLIMFIGLGFGRLNSITYGLVFGILYDIVYTQILGVYAFGFAFIGYMFVVRSRLVQDSLLIKLVLILFAIAFIEFYQYGLYQLIGITQLPIDVFINERLFPSVVVNSAFAILIYYPLTMLFAYVKKEARLRARL